MERCCFLLRRYLDWYQHSGEYCMDRLHGLDYRRME